MGTQTTNTAPQSTTNAQGNGSLPLPQSDRDVEHLQGHWLLARIGKRVLRPGGKKLTGRMLAKTELEGKDVVEFAPGLGRTTQLILERKPKSYRGVDRDPQVVDIITKLTAENAPSIPTSCALHDAADTGLESESADAVIGEAMLTMQTERGKRAIIAEAYRLLRAGGTYSIHELGLQPDDLPEPVKDEVRKALARSIKVTPVLSPRKSGASCWNPRALKCCGAARSRWRCWICAAISPMRGLAACCASCVICWGTRTSAPA